MNVKIAKRVDSFKEYIFSRLGKEIKQIEEESGRKVLNFGPGNPDFPPSRVYLEKFAEFIKEKESYSYPGFGAGNEFANALIYWYKKRFNVSIKKEELFPLLGAKDGVS